MLFLHSRHGSVKNDVIDHHLLRLGRHSHHPLSAVHGLTNHSQGVFHNYALPIRASVCLLEPRVYLIFIIYFNIAVSS
jgi:hypothetical protein